MRILVAILLAIFISFDSLTPASAQAERNKVQFNCVTWDKLPFDEIFYREGEEAKLLKIGKKMRLVEPQEIKSASTFQLYIKHIDEDDNKILKLVGQAPMPSKNMLFILEKNSENAELPIKIIALDDSLKSFPIGAFRFLNGTRIPVYIDFAGAKQKVEPSQLATIDAKAPELGGFQPFIVRYKSGDIAFESRLFAQPRGRKIAIFLPPTEAGGKLKLRFLPQIVPPKPPAKPKQASTSQN